MAGMGDQSRRPTGSPRQLSEEVVCRVVRLKQQYRHWGPRKIREVYGRSWGGAPSESSFKRVLERCGVTEKKRVREVKESVRLSSGRKASAPNEVWTVDFKAGDHLRNAAIDRSRKPEGPPAHVVGLEDLLELMAQAEHAPIGY